MRKGDEKTRAVADIQIPRNKKGVRIAKPGSDMWRKEVKFEYQDQQLAVFDKLKEALIGGPVLKLYNHSLETETYRASLFGFGPVLLQRDSGDN